MDNSSFVKIAAVCGALVDSGVVSARNPEEFSMLHANITNFAKNAVLRKTATAKGHWSDFFLKGENKYGTTLGLILGAVLGNESYLDHKKYGLPYKSEYQF